jgi:hypothetical protein
MLEESLQTLIHNGMLLLHIQEALRQFALSVWAGPNAGESDLLLRSIEGERL